TPAALESVRDLLDLHPAATGYCRLAVDDPRVNLTSSPVRDYQGRIAWKSYDFLTIDDVKRTEGPFPSWFGGWALTGMRRELWLRYPFEVNAGTQCQSDAQTAIRMARDGRFFASHRDAYIEHLKDDPNHSLKQDWLVGVEAPRVSFFPGGVA
ncbi:MAG: hypothetical protein IT428_13600, partial [Planctomycetaceae bacterium]|nr:hypothetical protein [Planctomycetaceae bacterium]